MKENQENPQLDKLRIWQKESKDLLESKTYTAAKNLKLIKGIFREQTTTSKVRNTEKLFFRKIWATIWRLKATMYQAFMKDIETFTIEGRDLDNDPRKAKVLQKITEYRRDKMMSESDLFIKHLWAVFNILAYGWTCGKIMWQFNEYSDDPDYILYPNDQVFPDMVAEVPSKMRYICFLNYMTKPEMDEMGWDTKDLVATVAEENQLRNTRFNDDVDGLVGNKSGDTNYASWAAGTGLGGNYPAAGSSTEASKYDNISKRYNIYECFWWEKGKVMYAVTNNFQSFIVEPEESPYGKFPIVFGQCLTEPHKLIGEGLPEPLEAPQESYNYNINMRKDNLAISMSGHTFVERGNNTDLQSLRNRRTGGITLTDNLNSVKHEQVPDITGNAYAEASIDEAMMDEMSGVTPGKRGMDASAKATIAQINYQESNTKIDLYVGIVGETYFRAWTRELARQIQMFESDERIFRIANERMRLEEGVNTEDVYFIDDFDADCIVNVGPGTVGQNTHVQQLLLAIDRGIMQLQSIPALAQMGMIPPQGLAVPNVTAMYEDLLPYIGLRNKKRYVLMLPPPNPAMMQGGGGGGGVTVPNNGSGTNNEMVQQGTLGGI